MRNIEIVTQTQSDLTSLADTKEYLSITGTDKDALLSTLISAGSQFVKTQTGYEWVETTYKETIDGEGNRTILLSNKPVISVASVLINDSEIDDYHIYKNSGMIKRKSIGFYDWKDNIYTGFPKGDLNIEVNYVAGYSEIPLDLQKAVWDLVNFAQESNKYPGLESYSIGDESLKFSRKDVPDEVMATLSSYTGVV